MIDLYTSIEPVPCDGCGRPSREYHLGQSGSRCISCIHRALQDEIQVGNTLRAALRGLTRAPIAFPADLMPAITAVWSVLLHGHLKHQGTPWRTIARATHQAKAEGHRRRQGVCPETDQPHRAHAISRELFLLQLELELEQEGS